MVSDAYGLSMFSGPVVLDVSGYSEKGFKRKLAVQALFGKVFYLSEVSCWAFVASTFYGLLYRLLLLMHNSYSFVASTFSSSFFFFKLSNAILLLWWVENCIWNCFWSLFLFKFSNKFSVVKPASRLLLQMVEQISRCYVFWLQKPGLPAELYDLSPQNILEQRWFSVGGMTNMSVLALTSNILNFYSLWSKFHVWHACKN